MQKQKPKFKLICFDVDGTIIDEVAFIWQTIHKHVGADWDKVKKATEDYYSKKISFIEWVDHDIGLWQKMGVTKKQMVEAIRPLKLMPGARETLKELKKKGYKLAIISGSLDFVLEHLLPDYKDFFDYTFINKIFFDENGKIKLWESMPSDNSHKVDELKIIIRKEKIGPEECVFVGDHENDIPVMEKAGLSIAFNCASEKLAQIADIVIEKKDLREILKFLD